MKRAFTQVLQGHIAIDSAVFPSGVTGEKLDILARRPLWHDRKDFGHGVGHGIGSFLAVHEGWFLLVKSVDKKVRAAYRNL